MKMSRAKIIQVSVFSVLLTAALCGMSACTATNDAESVDPTEENVKPSGGSSGGNKSDKSDDSVDSDSTSLDTVATDSSSEEGTFSFDTDVFKDYAEYLKIEKIPATTIKYGTTKNTVSTFYMASTEVTQGLYEFVMGSIPKQDKNNAKLPVVNVSWYNAVLFCNALSKKAGLDTAYVYRSIGDENYLEKLTIDYSVASIRLPTEMEWEIAARGGVTTRFYWGDDVASNYAYYGQSKGPAEVGGYRPNAYELYDMAGNVAEWVNDWYAAYLTADQVNPIGPETGASKCVRGGGWSDKVANIAPKERDKKDPLYHGVTLGFRFVYSRGF